MEEENKQSLFDKFLNSQLYKSIIRSGVPRTRRQSMYAVLGNVFLHLHLFVLLLFHILDIIVYI